MAAERKSTARARRAGTGTRARPVARRRAAPAARPRRATRAPATPEVKRVLAPEILLTLNREHGYIRSLLDALVEQVRRLRPGRTPDYTLLYEMAHYLSIYPDEHHHPREELVYDRLGERDPESLPLMGEVLEQHRELARRGRELVAELERVTRGGKEPDNRRIAYLCERYTGFFRDHLHAEEQQVFRRATAKLRQDDWCAINVSARYADDPDFPARLAREYGRLTDFLSDRVSRVTEDVAVAEMFGIESIIETVAALTGALARGSAIVRRHTRAAVRDVRRATRGGSGVLARSRAVRETLRSQALAAGEELREVLAGLRAETVEPFGARVKALRRLVRADVG